MPRNQLSIDDLRHVLALPKRIVSAQHWAPKNNTLRCVWSIEIDGVLEQGITFLAACQRGRADEDVALILRIESGLKPLPFARIDWRNKSHDNRQAVCGEHRFVSAGRTHFHDPNLHEHVDINTFFNLKIPIALPIHPEPADFSALLDIGAKLLHIVNLPELEMPPWAPQTLHT